MHSKSPVRTTGRQPRTGTPARTAGGGQWFCDPNNNFSPPEQRVSRIRIPNEDSISPMAGRSSLYGSFGMRPTTTNYQPQTWSVESKPITRKSRANTPVRCSSPGTSFRRAGSIGLSKTYSSVSHAATAPRPSKPADLNGLDAAGERPPTALFESTSFSGTRTGPTASLHASQAPTLSLRSFYTTSPKSLKRMISDELTTNSSNDLSDSSAGSAGQLKIPGITQLNLASLSQSPVRARQSTTARVMAATPTASRQQSPGRRQRKETFEDLAATFSARNNLMSSIPDVPCSARDLGRSFKNSATSTTKKEEQTSESMISNKQENSSPAPQPPSSRPLPSPAPSDCCLNNNNNGTTGSGGSTHSSHHMRNESRHLLKSLVNNWKNKYQENQRCYKEGGYLNASPGDTLQNRYELVKKLGWGEFSTVWLAQDRSPQDVHHSFVAVKIAKCHPSVANTTKVEVNLLKHIGNRVPKDAPVSPLLNAFVHQGTYGPHICMVMPLLGANVLSVIDQMKAKRGRRTDMEIGMFKEVTVAVLKSLLHLESINVVHTDLKPENVLVSCPDKRILTLIKDFVTMQSKDHEYAASVSHKIEEVADRHPMVTLADFGLSFLLDPVNKMGQRKDLNVQVPGTCSNSNGILIQTREYRAPEVLLGADFNCRSDIWSLGCMVYELITGEFLMDPKRKTRVETQMDIEHLAMIMQILGPVPNRVSCGTRYVASGLTPPKYLSRYFNDQGQFIYADRYRNYPRRSLAAELEPYLGPSEAERAAQFIMSCFTYDPAERCHARDLLRHSWLRSVQL